MHPEIPVTGARRVRGPVSRLRASGSDETIERISESSRGVIARVRFNHPPSGRGLEPRRVEHLQLGLTWRVTEILDRWDRPGRPEKMQRWTQLSTNGSSPWACCQWSPSGP